MLMMLLSTAFAVLAAEGEPETPADDNGGVTDDIGDDYSDGDDVDYLPEDDDYFEDELVGDDADAVEDNYSENTTIYDLEEEADSAIEPDETPPPEDADPGDADSEIYDDESYDAENAEQLQGEYVIDEIIVKFKEPWQVPGKEKQLQREIAKVQKLGFVENLDVYVISVEDLSRNPNAVLNRYKNNRYIEYVEPNYVMKPDLIPNDPNYKSQAPVLTVLNAQNGWDILKGSSTPIIAVVDSGCAQHPDLPPLLEGYAAVAGLSPYNDKQGHGTGVAGTIGCIGNNGIGSAGINWGASIMPVKIDDANGSISVANVAKGIIWAADNGAKIINLSLGYASDSTTLKNAIDYAYNKGCALFAATGNESKNAVCYPARYSNVMGVGSTTNGTSRVASSNYGPGINLIAFGGFYTAAPTGGYTNLSGTSFSTPQVAALASLVWTLNPDLTVDELYRMIEQGCKPLGGGYNEQTGYGVIDIGKTLQLAQDSAGGADAAAKAAAEAEAKAKAEAEAAAKAKAEAEAAAAAAAAAEAEAKAKAEAEAAAAAAAAQAAAEAEAKAKAEAEAAAAAAAAEKAAAEAAAAAAAEAEAKAKAEAEAAAAAAAEAAAKAAAEAEAKAKAEAEAAAAAEAEAKAKAEAEAAAQAKAEAEAKAKAEAEAKAAEEAAAAPPPESPQEVRNPPTIKLVGFTEMTLEYGQAFKESGYLAVDCKNNNLTGSVKVTNTIDIWKAGLYTVTYEVTDSAGLSARATRLVTVNPKPAEPEPPAAPKITIIGSNPIILHSTSSTVYKEQKAKAVDGDGKDISDLVTVSGTINRTVPGTYKITYSIKSPVTGLTATTTRDVKIVGPTEKKDPRVKYGLSGQAKAGAKVTHTGIVSSGLGFMDLQITSIDKNMTIIVQLMDTATKKAVLTDTFTAAGKKQYKIDQGKYELVVAIDKANGNSKYSIDLLMPEVASVFYFDEDEVPLYGMPSIAPVGSNPIILHLGGTPYFEQGAWATDYLGNEIPKESIITTGEVDESKAGTYEITYTVMSILGVPVSVTREVRIIEPNEFGEYELDEVPLDELPDEFVPGPQEQPAPLPAPTTMTYTVVKGDCLYSIAQKLYGNGNRWGEIYDMNRAVIGNDPRVINIGIVLTVNIR